MSEDTKIAIEALRQAMLNEETTHTFYVEAVEKVINAKGRQVFQELAEEEVVHIRIVRLQYESLKAGKGWTAVADFEHLESVDIRPLQFKRNELERQVTLTTTDIEALVIAAEMENNSFVFYVDQYNHMTDALGKEIYGYLVKAERTHFNIVMSNWEHLVNTGTW